MSTPRVMRPRCGWTLLILALAESVHSSEQDCAACYTLMEDIAGSLLDPHPSFFSKKVNVDVNGKNVEKPYTKTDQYVKDLLEHVCSSSRLASFRRKADWFGEITFEIEPIPQYSKTAAWSEQALVNMCEKLQPEKRQASLVRAALSNTYPQFCASLVEECKWRRGSGIAAGLRHFFLRAQEDPSVVFLLLPMACMLLSSPVFLVSFFRGAPDPDYHRHTATATKKTSQSDGEMDVKRENRSDTPRKSARSRTKKADM
mmetsp:Transcript_45072/g.75198  ORF Transcript_45072/g.75198 Transcript_45072/m.75198 type:complete len:258 (-) Transcript_45072:2629-3402(-)